MSNKLPELNKAGMTGISMQSPMKVGSTAVKTPKAKKMPGAFDKPSMFFKNENSPIKHPTLLKLKDFLDRTRSKKKISQ